MDISVVIISLILLVPLVWLIVKSKKAWVKIISIPCIVSATLLALFITGCAGTAEQTDDHGSTISTTTSASIQANATIPAVHEAEIRAPKDLSWLNPVAGAQAYLRDDGGSSTVATVCGSPVDLQQTYRGKTPRSCHTHHPGALVQILTTVPDREWALGSTTVMDAEIRFGETIGWVPIMQLDAIAPVGTPLACASENSFEPEIYPGRMSQSGGTDIGRSVHVDLLREYPYSGYWDLYVKVLDGPEAGSTGYMSDVGCSIAGTNYGPLTFEYDSKGEPLDPHRP